MTEPEAWHLDKKVPIAIIVTLALQTGGFFYWVGTTASRIDVLERSMLAAAPQAERIVRVETKLDTLKEAVAEIKTLLRPAR